MRPALAALLAATAWLSLADGAAGQLRQPRCQGWPARTGSHARTGLLVAEPGATCYGAVMDSVRADCTLLASRVVLPPRQGTFALTGLLDFTYTPRPGMRGPDRVEVGMDWECRGVRSANRARLNAMSPADYRALGGDGSRPPAGYGYDAR